MEVLNGLDDIKDRHRGPVLTIGNFDGVHVGHQKIVAEVSSRARALGARTMALTFEPHPLEVLHPERGVRVLTPLSEKARLLGHFGIDYVLVINFTREFSKTRADEFIGSVIADRIGAKAVVVGHNYSFGRGKSGTTSMLRSRGRALGFDVKVVRHAVIAGDVVSSSRVRSLIGWGRVCEASLLLGRPYSIEGMVVKGAGRGAKLLGTPTANIETEYKVVPKDGVYAVLVTTGGRSLRGVANIGCNPTFGCHKQSYEVHVLDFRGELGGKTMKVHFIDRIREERTFGSAAALKEQIDKDIASARALLDRKGNVRTL